MVDIGDRDFAAGLAFVAFSRVSTIDGLVLARDINPARLRDTNLVQMRQREEARLADLARQTIVDFQELLDDFNRTFI